MTGVYTVINNNDWGGGVIIWKQTFHPGVYSISVGDVKEIISSIKLFKNSYFNTYYSYCFGVNTGYVFKVTNNTVKFVAEKPFQIGIVLPYCKEPTKVGPIKLERIKEK